MENKGYKVSITLICIILGMLLVAQFRITKTIQENSVSYQRIEDLSNRLKQTEKEKSALNAELKNLRTRLQHGDDAKELLPLKMKAGLLQVKGQGVIVTLDDSKVAKKPIENHNLYLIHDEDLLKIINELRAAGAEALSINEQRLIGTSEIRCAGPTVSVNNIRSAPPYIIKAIGNPKTLDAALKMRGGVVDTLKFWGIHANIQIEKELSVPAYTGGFRFEYAAAADGGAK